MEQRLRTGIEVEAGRWEVRGGHSNFAFGHATQRMARKIILEGKSNK